VNIVPRWCQHAYATRNEYYYTLIRYPIDYSMDSCRAAVPDPATARVY